MVEVVQHDFVLHSGCLLCPNGCCCGCCCLFIRHVPHRFNIATEKPAAENCEMWQIPTVPALHFCKERQASSSMEIDGWAAVARAMSAGGQGMSAAVLEHCQPDLSRGECHPDAHGTVALMFH